jgi:hypothetical protein
VARLFVLYWFRLWKELQSLPLSLLLISAQQLNDRGAYFFYF